jgi:LPXTG-site transpeptidase (sortase) family protein
VALAQTALDREMLLVPVPPPGAGTAREGEGTVVPVAPPATTGTGPVAVAVAVAGSPAWGPVRIAQVALAVLAILTIGLVVQLAVIGRLQYRSAQVGALNTFRTHLALGTAPLGPIEQGHHLLPLGTPMALVTVPAIGLRAVVLEGTSGSVLTQGPGHVRTTVFPGGAGDSVLLGRASLYGGPFGRIDQLKRGDVITVVTQVGTSHFRVTRIRPAGARIRRTAAGTSELTLGTASGGFLTPSGVVWVDAAKVGAPLASSAPPPITLLASEAPLAVDNSTLWALLLWLEALAILLGLAVWTWRRWGHAQTWVIFTAPMLVVWLFIADQMARLLPNLT